MVWFEDLLFLLNGGDILTIFYELTSKIEIELGGYIISRDYVPRFIRWKAVNGPKFTSWDN